MPSSFQSVTRRVVRELDCPGNLIPTDSLLSSSCFQPYSLVGRKPSTSIFWKARYASVNLSIWDILEPGTPEPALQHSGPFCIRDTVDGQQVQVSLKLGALGQGSLTGGATVSMSSRASLNVCTLCVDPRTWETLPKKRRLRQPEHKVLQQLRSRGDNVYVVTEVLQTQEEVEVTSSHTKQGLGQLTLPGVTCLLGSGRWSQEQTLTIPSGSTLAFQGALLVVDPEWNVLLFPDKKKRTFQKPVPASNLTKRAGLAPPLFTELSLQKDCRFQSDGPMEELAVVKKDFAGLKAEVAAKGQVLGRLNCDLRQELLGALQQLLLDMPALQALEEVLEQGLRSGQAEPREGPAGTVLECLVQPSRELVKDVATAVFYLLGALTALSDTHQLLIAWALETGALQAQLQLVESILKQSSPWQESRVVSLPLELLGSSWGKDTPTWTLLEECGLQLQVDTSHMHWDPAAQGHACALYAAMVLLLGLGPQPL